jgi:DNA-binding response OmpR family regulator
MSLEAMSKSELLSEIQRLQELVAEMRQLLEKQNAYPNGKSDKSVRGTETVMLVDDSDDIRETVTHLLNKNGYMVLTARNGAEALELYRTYQGEIQLIMTDIVMPDFSGLELIRKLEPLKIETRVLFTSGYTGENLTNEDVMRIRALGANFIAKPFLSNVLLARIRNILDNR